jgi:hypothetical protein
MQPRPWMMIASCGLLIYGLACLLGYPAQQQRAAAVPRMSCEQLLKNGPGQDGYATLTDVRLCRKGYAIWRDAMSPGDVDVFVPVYAANLPREPEPHELTLLLEVQDAGDWQRLRSTEVVEFTCQVHSAADRVPDWAQSGLAEKYRGIRFADLKVLAVGLHEPTPAKARQLLWHGTLACGAGAALFGWFMWRRQSSGTPPPLVSEESA